MGAVDSPNLYAFVGWGPHMGTDPMGLQGGFSPGVDIAILGPVVDAWQNWREQRAREEAGAFFNRIGPQVAEIPAFVPGHRWGRTMQILENDPYSKNWSNEQKAGFYRHAAYSDERGH